MTSSLVRFCCFRTILFRNISKSAPARFCRSNRILACSRCCSIASGAMEQKDFGLPDMRGHAPIKELTYVIATNGIYPNRKKLEPRYPGAPLLGQLSVVAYRPKHIPPAGWAACDGQLLKIDNHGLLYALLGTTFGGDGVTTFGSARLTRTRTAQRNNLSDRTARQVPPRALSTDRYYSWTSLTDSR